MTESLGIIASGTTRSLIRIYSHNNIYTNYVTVYSNNSTSSRTVYEIIEMEVINERLTDTDFFRLMSEHDNFTNYNIYRATAKPIASISDGKIFTDKFHIAAPGTRVVKTDSSDIALVNDIHKQSGREKIGNLLKSSEVPVYIDFSQLFATHCSVVGRTGCGKTYLVTNLLKKMKRNYIVISPTDEYDNLNNNMGEVALDLQAINFSLTKFKKIFDLNNSEYTFLKEFHEKNNLNETVSSIELSEKIALYFSTTALQQANQEQVSILNNYMLIDTAKPVEIPKYVQSLCKKISESDLMISYSSNQAPTMYPHINNTQGMSKRTEEIVVFSILSNELERRKKVFKSTEKIKREDELIIIIEEAHNYAPSVKSTFCKDVISEISRVGRKYGLHLLILSQRPRFIDQTLLSQCGTNFIFNLPNPDDVDYIMSASNFYNPSYREAIQNFRTGECLIASNIRANDIMCKINFE